MIRSAAEAAFLIFSFWGAFPRVAPSLRLASPWAIIVLPLRGGYARDFIGRFAACLKPCPFKKHESEVHENAILKIEMRGMAKTNTNATADPSTSLRMTIHDDQERG